MAFKRDDLREKVLRIAEAEVARGGTDELRARTIALEAGVSVGTIYNLFGSLNGLLEELFTRVLARFHDVASGALGDRTDDDRRAALLALAEAYLDFVEGNEALWQSLLSFNRDRSDREDGMIDPYVTRQGPLFDLVGDVLRGTPLDTGDLARRRAARMLWSSVHGIVTLNYLGMANRETARETKTQIEMLVDLILHGMRANATA